MKKIIMLFTVATLLGCSKPDQTQIINKAEIEQPKSSWQVVVSKDEMRETNSKWLATRSENDAELEFPYDGPNKLQMEVLDSKLKNPRIFFTIDKGQYDCGHSTCYGAIKFGSTPVQEVTFKEYDVSGNDGTILIFEGNTNALLSNIRKFEKITVELPFYRNGTRQFKFSTLGFNEAEKEI